MGAAGPGPSAEIAVVLGARVHEGGRPSGALWARVECAAALYRSGRAKRLLLSGGVREQGPTEAEVMARVARELGVPEGALLLEQESQTTADNARLSARMLEALGVRRVLLVSDDFHLFRARRLFWAERIDAIPMAASRADRELTRAKWLYWTLREVFAIARRPGLLFVRRPAV